MTIKDVHYGSAFSDEGYDVNRGAGYAVGATQVAVDGGSGGIAAGTVVRFGSDENPYLVKEGITGSAGTITLDRGLIAAIDNDDAVNELALTKITDWLEEGWEPGEEEPQDVTYGDGEIGQDGVTVNGQVYAIGTNLPTVGTRTWIRYSGSAFMLIGGRYGCRISRGKSGPRTHGAGPRYEMVKYSAVGSGAGSVIINT